MGMMMRVWTRIVLTAGLVALASLAVGCKSTSYKKFNLTVALDEAYARSSGSGVTKVDVVALSGQRASSLDAVPMREYWTESDPYRRGLVNEGVLWTVELSAQNPSATLSSREKIWNSAVWKTGGRLYILADIPGVGPGRDGVDPRRLALPRDSELWSGNKLDVRVNSQGMSYTPQEKVSGQR